MAEERLSSWASLVPEVYFDLIARVPAGATIILAFVSFFEPKGLPTLLTSRTLGPVLVLILIFFPASYLIGLMLTLPSGLIAYGSRWLVWRIFIKKLDWYPDLDQLVASFGFLRPKQVTSSELVRIELETHDFLRSKNEDARSLFPKMRAEAELCSNLSAALAALIPLEVVLALASRNPVPDSRSILLLVGLSGYTAGVGAYRIWRLLDRQIVLLRVLPLINRP